MNATQPIRLERTYDTSAGTIWVASSTSGPAGSSTTSRPESPSGTRHSAVRLWPSAEMADSARR
jgi:hypothetical protein